MSKNTQICATIPKDVSDSIIEISEKSNRSFSQTVSILLQQAVKEKMRKRNATKEGNSKHNTAD